MKFNLAVLMIVGAGAIQLRNKSDPTICYKGVVECDTPVVCTKADPENGNPGIACKRDKEHVEGKKIESAFVQIEREPLLTWSPSAHKSGHPVDYFVPNFGPKDEDISETQKNIKNLGVKFPSFVQTGFWTQAPDGAPVDNTCTNANKATGADETCDTAGNSAWNTHTSSRTASQTNALSPPYPGHGLH